MNKFLKKILLGFLIWAVPFFTSFFVWDMKNQVPLISMDWFNALMAFTWAIGFAIAACAYFKEVKKRPVLDGWITGVTWYIELLVLDLLILVIAFKMSILDYFPMVLMYLNVIAISASIGYIKRK